MEWLVNPEIEVKNAEIPMSGVFSGVVEKNITFIEHDGLKPCVSCSYHMVNTKKFDEYWSKDSFFYIPKDLSDVPDLNNQRKYEGKRNKLIKAVAESGVINAPIFDSWLMEDGVKFEDGRNRVALIRELGIEYFLALIPDQILSEFKEHDLLA